jgi:hypothetical protein
LPYCITEDGALNEKKSKEEQWTKKEMVVSVIKEANEGQI